MGVTEQRMEQLGITLQQTDWRGKGAVEAVLAGDMLYISAHYPVDETGTPVYVGRVGAEIDEAAAYQAARLCGLNMLRTIQAYWQPGPRGLLCQGAGPCQQRRGLLQHACRHERLLRPDGRDLWPPRAACPCGHGRLRSTGQYAGQRGRHC